jgi:hypothetical protein
LNEKLDWEFVFNRLTQINDINKKTNAYINVLLIIDDFISELNKERYSIYITKLIFNRRHLIENGMVSIILTSQKYSLVNKFKFNTILGS